MAAIGCESKSSSQNTKILFEFPEKGWDLTECTDAKIQNLVVRYFEALCLDANQRTEQVLKDRTVLEKGFWYANEYMQYLKFHQCKARLEWLKQKGNFYHGYPPNLFIHSKVDASQIDCQKQLTDKKNCRYVLRSQVLASDGLNELIPGANSRFYFIDCQSLVEIAHYCALRVIFGKEGFNTYFNSQKNPLTLDPIREQTPLYALLDMREGGHPPRYGDNCFFRNVPVYAVKHMDGEAMGLHVLCTKEASKGKEKYGGFGLKSFHSATRDVYTLFANEFNKDFIPITDLLPQCLAEKRKSKTYDEVSSKTARKIQELIMTADAIAETAAEYPDQAGLHPRKSRLSERAIQVTLTKLKNGKN